MLVRWYHHVLNVAAFGLDVSGFRCQVPGFTTHAYRNNNELQGKDDDDEDQDCNDVEDEFDDLTQRDRSSWP